MGGPERADGGRSRARRAHTPAFPKARLRGLHVEPPRARVDEVFAPAGRTAATRDRIESATTPWGWIAAGALAAALVLLLVVARSLHRRRHVEVAPT